jgi:hypothetical protein
MEVVVLLEIVQVELNDRKRLPSSMRVGNCTCELQLEILPLPSSGQKINLWRNVRHS